MSYTNGQKVEIKLSRGDWTPGTYIGQLEGTHYVLVLADFDVTEGPVARREEDIRPVVDYYDVLNPGDRLYFGGRLFCVVAEPSPVEEPCVTVWDYYTTNAPGGRQRRADKKFLLKSYYRLDPA